MSRQPIPVVPGPCKIDGCEVCRRRMTHFTMERLTPKTLVVEAYPCGHAYLKTGSPPS